MSSSQLQLGRMIREKRFTPEYLTEPHFNRTLNAKDRKKRGGGKEEVLFRFPVNMIVCCKQLRTCLSLTCCFATVYCLHINMKLYKCALGWTMAWLGFWDAKNKNNNNNNKKKDAFWTQSQGQPYLAVTVAALCVILNHKLPAKANDPTNCYISSVQGQAGTYILHHVPHREGRCSDMYLKWE